METDREDHTVGDSSELMVLLGSESEIDDNPQNQPRSHLIERFNVKGANAGVEAPTDEPLWERRDGQSAFLCNCSGRRYDLAAHIVDEAVSVSS